MRRPLHLWVATWLLGFACAAMGNGVRVKDIAIVSGVRDNQLAGYGLVAGLAGDGDKNPSKPCKRLPMFCNGLG